MVGIVRTAKVNAGMRVLVHAAAGGVDSIAVQLAHMRGATVIATCSQRNLDFVRDLGAREVIAYDQTTFELQVRDLDVVFDLIGGDVHRWSYQVLRPGGMMVCLAAAPYEDQSAQFGVKTTMPHVMSR
jgi:NADPH:quinone reductase-like Zn-dependent oxidoreductase